MLNNLILIYPFRHGIPPSSQKTMGKDEPKHDSRSVRCSTQQRTSFLACLEQERFAARLLRTCGNRPTEGCSAE